MQVKFLIFLRILIDLTIVCNLQRNLPIQNYENHISPIWICISIIIIIIILLQLMVENMKYFCIVLVK